jgi:hypothetical protein
MSVSRSTVKAHLSHVYSKLGIANRTELAALASGGPDHLIRRGARGQCEVDARGPTPPMRSTEWQTM